MMLAQWKRRAKELKTEVAALYLALKDPRVSKATKLALLCIVAYALSPIDLIPDFIPVLGYLDDLILIPLGIMLVMRFIPEGVMAECRARAQQKGGETKTIGWIGAAIIVVLWLLTALLVGTYLKNRYC
jgi:uncharacterized membrane protein YkvA (DUF1232 family)